jgi:hypothetical protein
MTSSTNSPFKLEGLQVRENDRLVYTSKPHFARFVFSDVQRNASVLSWHDTLMVAGTIELANTSWMNPDKIGSTIRIGSFGARVEFDISMVFEPKEPSYEDALWFACKELNPMLESYTTLFGIKHNIDITVEHGLRPVTKLLQNIVQPRPGHIKFKTKGRYNL